MSEGIQRQFFGKKDQKLTKSMQKISPNESMNIDHNSQTRKSIWQRTLTSIKSTIQDQLKLKRIIQRARKIEFMNNIPASNTINIKQTLYINIFVLFNSAIYGIYMFSNRYYRRLRYAAFYLLGLTYLGFSTVVLWEDRIFINAISTKQDAYKSQIKYVLRKQCLENLKHLQRFQNKRSTLQKLNLEFEQFHSVQTDHQLLSLLH